MTIATTVAIKKPARVVSFCFDDGFRHSAEKIRAMFEHKRIAACFAVLAAPQRCTDPFIKNALIAGWDFWRETQAAGHEVAPHGYAHEHLGKLDHVAARRSIESTFEIFLRELPGFHPRRCLFHLPYLTAPYQLVQWLRGQTLGVRIAAGNRGLNATAAMHRGGIVDCVTFGPDDTDARSRECLCDFLHHKEGWLVMVFHGLDGEGWGTLSSQVLMELVDITLAAGAAIEPPNRVMQRLVNLRG